MNEIDHFLSMNSFKYINFIISLYLINFSYFDLLFFLFLILYIILLNITLFIYLFKFNNFSF